MNRSEKNDITPPQSQLLPEGWHIIRFGDVAKKISNIVDRRNCDLDNVVAGEHMQTDNFRIKEWGTIDEGYLGPAFNHKFTKGQILYGSRRTYLRKVSIPHFDGVCSNTTFVIEPTGYDLVPELLPFIMQSAGFTDNSIRMSKGSTNPYINWKDIASYEFAIPGKQQQLGIATTLWAIEDCIVKGERFLIAAERVKKAMKRELFSKGIRHTDLRVERSSNIIPSHWDFAQFSDVVDYQEGPGILAKDFEKNGIPLIRLTNIQNSVVNLNGCNFLSDEKVKAKWNHFRLEKGDILISSSASTGLVSEIIEEGIGAIAYTGIIRLRPKNDRVLKEYLKKYVASDHFFKQINMMKTGSVIHHFGPSHLEAMKIPLPPLPEQCQIAFILTCCDETIATALSNIAATKALKMKMINEMLSPKPF